MSLPVPDRARPMQVWRTEGGVGWYLVVGREPRLYVISLHSGEILTGPQTGTDLAEWFPRQDAIKTEPMEYAGIFTYGGLARPQRNDYWDMLLYVLSYAARDFPPDKGLHMHASALLGALSTDHPNGWADVLMAVVSSQAKGFEREGLDPNLLIPILDQIRQLGDQIQQMGLDLDTRTDLSSNAVGGCAAGIRAGVERLRFDLPEGQRWV